jgi:hypothetical protein
MLTIKRKASAPVTVQNCVFNGVSFPQNTVEFMNSIVAGLQAQTQVYQTLANVLKYSNVQIDAMLKLETEKDKL